MPRASRLVKWARKKCYESTEIPPMPVLPSERLRVLTPTPSRESLALSATTTVADSPFFQKLPYEIRHRVLVFAFGADTVHMDLAYDHPMLPLDRPVKYPAHCCLNIGKGLENHHLKRDIASPKQWQWWSSVCHRSFPGLVGSRYGTEACDDQCRYGGGDWCSSYAGNMPRKCFIGAMGWLLSCRQASVIPSFLSIALEPSKLFLLSEKYHYYEAVSATTFS
jgi:hypothetical protein